MSQHKTGLILGSFLGLFHFVWGVLIALGFAQPLLDFILKIHLLNNPFTVAPFNLMTCIVLIIVTSLVGYVFGYVFAILWNKFHK